MSNVISSIFDKGPSKEEKAARKLQEAKAFEIRRRETRENRRRASTAKTLSTAQFGGSLFPSDFAPSSSTRLG